MYGGYPIRPGRNRDAGISAKGVFHFPNRRAGEIAVETVTDWRLKHPGKIERVIFNVFKEEDRAIYESLLS